MLIRSFTVTALAGGLSALATLMPAPAHATLVMDFNYPAYGIINDNVEPCGGGEVSSYTENGILADSYCTPIQNLLVDVPSTTVPGLFTGNYFSAVGIQLVGGGQFNVVSFELLGCGGTLEAYQGSNPLGGIETADNCILGLATFDVLGEPEWSNLTSLLFSADGSGLQNNLYMADLVLSPAVSAPEPSSLALWGAALASLLGLGALRRRKARKAA